jgi:hypothetical protein
VTKAEREELRRLLRSRFKVLRADVELRQVELRDELTAEIDARFAHLDKAYDDAMVLLQLAVDEANRKANDLGRELWGAEKWGQKHDRQVIVARAIDRPGVSERRHARVLGEQAIETRVKGALLELNRQENELLTELATGALESTEAKQFFGRIPILTELVPAYRLPEILD